MKTAIIITLLLISSAAFAGSGEKNKEWNTQSSRPGHKVTIDLDQLSHQTIDISLLQPVIVVAKWLSRPVPVHVIRKEKSFFI